MCSIFSMSSFCSISLYHLINSDASFNPISIYASLSAFDASSLSIRCFSLLRAAAFNLTSARLVVKSGAGRGLTPSNFKWLINSFSTSAFTISP
jgi:hypothetical protein